MKKVVVCTRSDSPAKLLVYQADLPSVPQKQVQALLADGTLGVKLCFEVIEVPTLRFDEETHEFDGW